MQTRIFRVHWDLQLGSGGEGRVYLAESAIEQRPYAIKFPNALIPAIAQLQTRQELLRVLRVVGEHVVRPVAWNLGYKPFLVYELALQGTLRDEMDSYFGRGLVYDPQQALRRTVQMLLGIRDSHRSGIVHRDVKPENFLIFSDDVVKLNDFGLGRTMNRPYWNQTQAFVGTLNYAAPEQILRNGVDGRADLYAVGGVLYEMLTSRTPGFTRPLAPPSFYAHNILLSLDSFCDRMLSLNKSLRPATVDQALFTAYGIMTHYLRLQQQRPGRLLPRVA
jgi:eukaryotic-like serine/threonine-protein kinase